MAYLAGTCTSLIDLLTTIKTFLTDNGWTLDGWKDSLTGAQGETQAAGKELHIHKDSMYFSIKTCNNIRPFYGCALMSGFGIIGATGYDDAKTNADWAEQPGYPTNVQTAYNTEAIGAIVRTADGAYNYYLFLINDTFICCFENITGGYKWMAFGNVVKFGTWTGGMFFAGCDHNYSTITTMDNSFMRRMTAYASGENGYSGRGFTAAVYVESGPSGTGWYANGHRSSTESVSTHVQFSNFHGVCSYDYYAAYEGEAKASFAFPIYKNGYNSMTAKRPQIPILVSVYDGTWVYSTGDDNKYFPIGQIDGLRVLNMQNLAAGDEIVYGGETWKIFPNHIQAAADNLSNVGLAVKKS